MRLKKNMSFLKRIWSISLVNTKSNIKNKNQSKKISQSLVKQFQKS